MSGETESASAAPAQQKYSRYRARKQISDTQSQPEVESKENQTQEVSRTKSMSRYRRRSAGPASSSTSHSSSASPPIPEIPRFHLQGTNGNGNNGVVADVMRGPRTTIQGNGNTSNLLQVNGGNFSTRSMQPQQGLQRQQQPSPIRQTRPVHVRPNETEDERLRRKVKEFQEREIAKRRAVQEQEAEARRIQEQKEEAEALATRLTEADIAKKLADQKRKDLERLQAQLDAVQPVTTLPREKVGVLKKKPSVNQVPPTNSATLRTASLSPPVNTPPKVIEHGGVSLGPRTDAPISASNAGERRVLIRCKQSSINLPITPQTTPVDIIYSAANIMTQNIIPSTAILLESYATLGLERRIRRYEHIRDIMNSWDRDTQNALVLQNSDTPKFDQDLEVSSVSKEAPGDFTVYMYHSQKPGKWNKRYITLLSNGQMFTSKKSGAKISDKDVVSICHVSDFDIYTPTPQQLRKALKPPKKHCYAIKSQQKTTMFLNTENFVHFFNTDDEALADKFYDAVQKWRSWYLVNRLGEGKKKPKANAESASQPENQNSTLNSDGEKPYTIGSFTPLMTLDRFGSPSDEHDSDEESRPRQIPFHLRNSISAAPLPTRQESKRHPPPVSYKLPPEAEEEFAASGLLGQSYAQRQLLKKERQREKEARKASGSLFAENSLLSSSFTSDQHSLSMKPSSASKRPDTSAGTGLGRGMPKPLLDFTPTFKEAPQWDKTGKGRGVDAPAGVPLIEVANTSIKPSFGDIIPNDTVFRRDDASPIRDLRPSNSGEALLRPRSGGERPKTGSERIARERGI